MAGPAVTVRPVDADDVGTVSRFLHEHLNPRVTAENWAKLLLPPWPTVGPNRGFLLQSGSALVGVFAAVYSEREINQQTVKICNLAAFCVLDDYRMHALRLLRALLGQRGYEFTDLSPSGNVVALNERLGFERLPVDTKLLFNLPRFHPNVRVSAAPQLLARTLRGADARIYRDHRQAPAARHLLIVRDGDHAYLMFRRERRRRLPLFATPLYVGGDLDLLAAAWPNVGAYLLWRHGLPFTLAEPRVLGFEPRPGRRLKGPRPRMFRSRSLRAEDVDYLYSELTLVSW